jgi:hypothetical protein
MGVLHAHFYDHAHRLRLEKLFYLGPVSAKNHPAPGVAVAVLLKTFPAFRPELRFSGGSCGSAKKCRAKKLGSEIALGKKLLAKKSLRVALRSRESAHLGQLLAT